MAFDFPSSPTLGQQFTPVAGTTYTYNGVGWTLATGAAGTQVGFRAHKNGVNQTGLATITWTKITFGFEDYDTGSLYDTATSRWTPPSGIIHIDAAVGINSGVTASTNFGVAIYKNGAELKRAMKITGTLTPDSGGQQISLDDTASGTDYYEIWAYGLSAAPWDVLGSVLYTFFDGHIVGTQGAAGVSGPAVGVPQGRPTLQTATPVMTTSQTAKTTLYYTPYHGNLCPIYDGANFSMSAFNELSALTTDATKSPAAIGVSKVNDWFVWNDAGTIRLGHGPDWTDDSTRSAGTALVMVNGILLNNAAITNGPAAQRGTYIATTRSNASSQLNWQLPSAAAGGGAGILGVWSAYNRVMSGGECRDTTSSWITASTTIRMKNASANNSIAFVSGLQEDLAQMVETHGVIITASDGTLVIAGIGVDSSTAFTSIATQGLNQINASGSVAPVLHAATSFGYHVWNALEANNAAVNVTTFGAVAGPPARNTSAATFSFLM